MRDNKSNKLTFIVILAAVVAALTTVTVLLLRARAKRKSMCSHGAAFDYDLDDCDSEYFDADDCDCGYCESEDAAEEEHPEEE